MYGWHGKILRIDLSSGESLIEDLGLEARGLFIGGRGLAGYYLKKYCTLPWSDPEMPILIFTGPLTGTIAPTSGRATIMSKSPLTGTVGDTSVGGSLGTELKKAGVDGIIITGRSENYRGIEIVDRKITITDCEHLKGKTTGEITSVLKGKGAAALTGPAAENGVKFSSVIVDGHYVAGRGGIGLNFSSKNLKYITIKGSGRTNIFDRKKAIAARDDIVRLTSASPAISGAFGISKFGTGALYDLMDSRRMMPTDNFRSTKFDSAQEMNAGSYRKKFDPESIGCKGCHILCKKKTKSGKAIPEYETMSHFSALLSNNDLNCVIEANELCNELGMDTISAAASLASYSEINDRKLEPEEIKNLLSDIAYGKGEGKELAAGSASYASSKGKGGASISVKGLDLPAYDPRGAYGMALSYATSTRGACHLRAYPVSHEILRKPAPTDRFSFTGKARIIKLGEDLNAAVDSLTACKFTFFGASIEEYAKMFSAVTGNVITGNDLMKAGERIVYNERLMNSLNGFRAEDDDLPERFFKSPGYSDELIEVKEIDREAFLKARSDYYKVRGLDPKGRPLKEKAEELGLSWRNVNYEEH